MSRIAYVNGRYVPQHDAVINIEDRGYQFADGVYEVIGVLDSHLIDTEPHFVRLKRSLDELRMDPPCSRRVIEIILNQVIRRNKLRNGFLYLQITRGVASRNHAFPDQAKPALVVTASLKGPPGDAQVARGVAIVTVPENRWGRADIKSVSLLPNILAKQHAVEQGVYEAWFVDRGGKVTEGSSTNAWIVLDGQEIVTRPLGNDILAGITRQSVLKVARENNFKVTERAFSIEEAQSAREAFITSTTAFVLPVVKIDGKDVGGGKPGPVALALLDCYRRYIAGEIQ
jgi:D-alanine transaminase